MDQELYSALKKEKPHTVEKLIQEHLARSWFLCQETTMDSAMAGPLLLSSWERAPAACRGDTPPATGSGTGDSGGMGGFGGAFPGGMDFSDFDFSNFDPSTMPQGGSFPGMSS